jgi:hypothetical protein
MYYPKSEILKVEYTTGNEFLVKRTNKLYTGYYYATNDGKYFSGQEYNSTTVELVRPFNKTIGRNESRNYDFHYAMPTDSDYTKGFFTRYVIKRVNSGLETIKEVSLQEYTNALLNPLYAAKSFVWKLKGPLYTTKEGVPGIVNTNQKTLDQLEKSIPEVRKYFTNLAQYAK